jgi:catecholate siderophore receptor
VLATALAAAAMLPMVAAAQGIPAENDPLELGPLRVEDRNQMPLEQPSGLARLPGTVQDTPQTINVITSEVLQQQAVTTLDQALRNVAGITLGVGEGGGAFNGDQFRIRGFDTKDDIYVDGLRDFGVYTRDSFNYESIEVLKGPSGLLFGRGTTGGGINTQSKVPMLDRFIAGTGSIGSGDFRRFVGDVNMPIGNTTAIRVNFMAHGQEVVGRDLVKADRWGIAPSIGFGLGTDTTFTLALLHQQDDRIPDYGIPTLTPPGETYAQPVTELADVDRETFYGFTRDYDDTTADMVTARFNHRALDWLTLSNDMRVGVYSREFSATRVSCNATCLTNLFDDDPLTEPFFTPGAAASGTGPYSMNLWGIQDIATAVATAPIGGLRNTLVTGVDVSYLSSKRHFYTYSTTRPNRDVFAPDHDFPYSIVPHTTPTAVANSFAEGRNYAVFASDQLWFTDALSVILGARVDYYSVTYESVTVANVLTEITTDASLFNPKASLVFEPSPFQTYYFSWARSATPQGTSVTNQPTPVSGTVSAGGFNTRDLEPEENDILEAGAKFGFFEGRLGLTASVFRINKNNARADDGLGNIISSGDAQRVQGIEIGLVGTITENWDITANYAFLDSETTESTSAAAVGQRVPNVPEHSAALWTTYSPIPDLTLGVGATYSGEVYLNNTNLAFVPEAFGVDALIAYQIGQWRLQLNATNLFDRLNYAGSRTAARCPPPDAHSSSPSARSSRRSTRDARPRSCRPDERRAGALPHRLRLVGVDRRESHGRRAIGRSEAQSSTPGELGAGAPTGRDDPARARPEPAVQRGRPALARLSAAVQSLRRGHAVRVPCRQRNPLRARR